MKGKHSRVESTPELKSAYSSVPDFTSLSSETMLLIFRESSPESEAFRSGWVRGVTWTTEMLSSPHQEHCGQGFPPELWTYLSVLVCVCVSSTELSVTHISTNIIVCFSVAKSCPTLCNPMDCRLRLPCPSVTPGVCSNARPLSW